MLYDTKIAHLSETGVFFADIKIDAKHGLMEREPREKTSCCGIIKQAIVWIGLTRIENQYQSELLSEFDRSENLFQNWKKQIRLLICISAGCEQCQGFIRNTTKRRWSGSSLVQNTSNCQWKILNEIRKMFAQR